MQYRPIGNTGISASIIGLGAEHLDTKPSATVDEVIGTALEQGINMMDLFMPGETVRTNIGKALAGKRDKMHIQGHIGSTDINEQYDVSRDLGVCKKYFENLLRCLHTDYIDFGMLFFIDSEKSFTQVFEGEILKYAQDLKKQGTIRAIGASSHNPIIARRMVETGILDLLMFSINPAFDMAPRGVNVLDHLDGQGKPFGYEKNLDSDRATLYRLCEQRGVGITVMKTLGAGKLLSKEHTPFSRELTVGQCIHYALTRPAVVSTLIGCSSAAQVHEAVGYLDMDDTARDYSGIIEQYQGSFKGNCVYCNHCLPCPQGINIADVNKYLDIAVLDEKAVPPSITQHYKALNSHGSDCIACGSCEERCPFSVPVIKNMERAAALFGV
ncbi:aldo/keto reductase [Treponema primitia]|uniref:aldo/keto reductase n=1 Tax=Treponema primitia TaxID=88058 RepID=UPI0004745248|nr:aldo/keto reductase [Treponema primitia]